jgi:hypothetical protein
LAAATVAHKECVAVRGKLGGKCTVATHGKQMRNGAAAAQASVNALQLTLEDRTLGGANGTAGGGNKEGCGVGSYTGPRTKTDQMQANYVAFCDAFPHKVPAKVRYVRNYLQLHEFGLRFMNKSGKNNNRISKINTKRKYSIVN